MHTSLHVFHFLKLLPETQQKQRANKPLAEAPGLSLIYASGRQKNIYTRNTRKKDKHMMYTGYDKIIWLSCDFLSMSCMKVLRVCQS